MKLSIELETEEDGRFIAAVPEIPGVLVYGFTQQEAISKAQALALRVLAEQVEYGEATQQTLTLFRLPPDLATESIASTST
ncbi:HicB family protein [Cyanosarcina cf. burmensis CCALA 770]|nr:HicB family protein [Cyanosarcina cf. burmensis CCALA 770]